MVQMDWDMTNASIGGELSSACAHRSAYKRMIKQTTDLEDIKRLKERIKEAEATIERLQQ
jgi:hypothetical protein